MSRTWNEILVPVNGTITVNAPNYTYEGDFYAIKVDSYTEISELISNIEEWTNVVGDYIVVPTTAVKAGTLITPLNPSKPFKAITVVSGQVTLVL